MSQPLDYNTVPSPQSQPGLVLAIAAWCIVGMIAILLPVMNEVSQRFTPPVEGVDMPFQMQGQYTLGAARALDSERKRLLDQFVELAQGGRQAEAAAVLRAVAEDPKIEFAPDQIDLGPRYPWYSQLADLDTRDAAIAKAESIFARIVVLAITGLGIAATALAMGILAIILLATGKLRFAGLRPAAPAGLYIEAFAVWLAMYLLGSIFVELVLRGSGGMAVRMVPLVFAFVIAVAWPTIRGARWDVVRRDIGLHTGRGVFVEIGAGIAGYLACLPMVAASMLFVLIVQYFAKEQASHPIQELLTSTNPIWIYLLAAVFAPLTEELVFRGLLLTHLRAKLGIWTSGLISGLIFAAIHPQGWIAIPTLMTIALALALIREWRQSLIAPVIAHALNNAAVVTLMVLIMR